MIALICRLKIAVTAFAQPCLLMRNTVLAIELLSKLFQIPPVHHAGFISEPMSIMPAHDRSARKFSESRCDGLG
eukprot:5665726-Pleurochrysis_carterae.AAC.1